MKDFDEFLNRLLDKPSSDTVLRIKGEGKRIKGMARYTSENYDFDYIKIALDDNSHVIVVPSEKDVAYADKALGEAEGVSDEMIGEKEVIYKGDKYLLENGNDKQKVLEVYVGKLDEDIEGEVEFSDYINEKDDSLVLSLGWITKTKERADVLAQSIKVKDVEVVN